jgi:hypothetical protein
MGEQLTIPPELIALSEAATPGQLRASPTHWGFVGLDAAVGPEQWDGNLLINGQPHLSVLRGPREDGLRYEDAVFLAAAWNYVRNILADPSPAFSREGDAK